MSPSSVLVNSSAPPLQVEANIALARSVLGVIDQPKRLLDVSDFPKLVLASEQQATA